MVRLGPDLRVTRDTLSVRVSLCLLFHRILINVFLFIHVVVWKEQGPLFCLPQHTQLAYGIGKAYCSYPISRGRLINLIGFVTVVGREDTKLDDPPIVEHIPKQDLLEHYPGWEPGAQYLLQV